MDDIDIQIARRSSSSIDGNDVEKLSDITSGLLRELELKKDDLRVAAEMGQLLLKKNADITNENSELKAKLGTSIEN